MTASLSPVELRRIILEQSRRANVGHIGPALSVVEILASLYSGVLSIGQPEDSDRDRFILSKGHAALALYATLFLKGFITREELDSFCTDGTPVGVHPEHRLSGVDFSTGSLGQGLAYGTGAALAARMDRSARRVYVLLSDAECNEGSLWESIMFAAHHKLSTLTAIVDDNGQQALGRTREVIDLQPLAEKWQSFGWHAVEVDGHDLAALEQALAAARGVDDRPSVLIARTLCGKGVSYMEGKVEWHYLPMSDEEYDRALSDLERE